MTRSVPQLAKYFQVAPKKVRGWIESGELEAINLATRTDQRPRLYVEDEAVEAFKTRRKTKSAKPASGRRKAVSVPAGYFPGV